MAHLIVLHPDIRARARIREALGGSHRCSEAAGWSDLGRLLEVQGAEGCLVDADAPSREEALSALVRIRRRHPDIALVVWAEIHHTDLELARLGALGVDEVLQAHRPPWASGIRRATEQALEAARARRAVRVLGGRIPPTVAAAVLWAVEHASRAPTVGGMAAALGLTSRDLRVALSRAGLPTPSRLLVWGRLIQAGALVAWDGRTAEEASLRVGYATAAALSRAMRREVAASPGEVARRGGLPFVVQRLFPRGALRPHLPKTGDRTAIPLPKRRKSRGMDP